MLLDWSSMKVVQGIRILQMNAYVENFSLAPIDPFCQGCLIGDDLQQDWGWEWQSQPFLGTTSVT